MNATDVPEENPAKAKEILKNNPSIDLHFKEKWGRLGTKKSTTGEMVYEELWMNDDLHGLLMW